MADVDVAIVGAGLAGLTAARTLEAAGRSVAIVDKGRSVGGRLATRRIGAARLDHGAQFFTVRGDDFESVVREAMADDIVYEWCRGFDEVEDGFPRYAARLGMNALAKWLGSHLAATPDTGVEIDGIGIGDAGIELTQGGVVRHRAATTIVTAPVPQTLALLEHGGLEPQPDVEAALRGVRYFATLALLATLDGAPRVGGPGGEQHEHGPFTFVSDNHRKGISPTAALTAHADHDYSLRRYDDPPDAVLQELLELARPWIDGQTVIEAQLKKWRYAGPVEPLPDRCLVSDHPGGRLVFAGDAFGGPKVEGAFNSGRAAATAALAG